MTEEAPPLRRATASRRVWRREPLQQDGRQRLLQKALPQDQRRFVGTGVWTVATFSLYSAVYVIERAKRDAISRGNLLTDTELPWAPRPENGNNHSQRAWI